MAKRECSNGRKRSLVSNFCDWLGEPMAMGQSSHECEME